MTISRLVTQSSLCDNCKKFLFEYAHPTVEFEVLSVEYVTKILCRPCSNIEFSKSKENA